MKLTNSAAFAQEVVLQFPSALHVLHAVPPVSVLADLLAVLVVNALDVPDGGSTQRQKEKASCSIHTLRILKGALRKFELSFKMQKKDGQLVYITGVTSFPF